jgi:uncharacterized membrane protein
MTSCRSILATAILLLAACHQQPNGAPANGTADDGRPYDGIAENETLHFTGTEPFWGGQVTGSALTYTTPENQAGQPVQVERFAGRGGISFTGTLDGQEFVMMATPLACSDGMSDRSYPFTITLAIGEETRAGCGWTQRKPFEGPAHP